MDDNHEHHEPVSYGLLVLVWLSLLVLTALTVTVAGMNLGALSVAVAVVIATIKSSVVLFFFMHLKYEKTVYKIMVFVCLGTFAIFLGITFLDQPFR